MAFTGKGRFDIGRQLGSGAFGAVFEAYDNVHARKVAIKLLTRLSGDTLVAFKREFRSVSAVRHPNVVARYELLSDGNIWFFTMELVEGLELLEYLARNEIARASSDAPRTRLLTPQYLRDLRVTLKQIVDGVSALHNSGHLHRDIKSSNVLVTTEGRVVLVDFGLAMPIAECDAVVGGTPGYMSPEQATSRVLTTASDWFSVGVVLYEALTGTMPWVPDSIGNADWFGRPPTPPRELVPDVPQDLNDLCLDLLAPSPADRPAQQEIRQRAGADSLTFTLPAVRSATLGQPAFVGRIVEREALHTAFRRTLEGELVTVSVRGDPGIGKTALINRFFDELRHKYSSVTILAGRCSAREWVPYNALDVVVERLASSLLRLPSALVHLPHEMPAAARLFPVLDAVPAIRRACMFAPDASATPEDGAPAIAELLHALCTNGPVVVFIDDAQWGDRETGLLLKALLDRPRRPPILLITSVTTNDAGSCLMLRACGNRLRDVELDLAPLTPEDSDVLARAILDQYPRVEAPTDPIVRESGGNPFLIEFLARHRKRRPDGVLRLVTALRQEVEELDADARWLLLLIAAAGEPVEVSAVYRAAGVGGHGYEALSALREKRLARSRITGAIEEVEVYHRRVREALLRDLDEATFDKVTKAIAGVFVRPSSAVPDDPDADVPESSRSGGSLPAVD